MTSDPEHLSAEDEAFLDEAFDLAFRCRSTGEAFDLEAIASRRPHLRDRVLRISELARDVAVSSPPPIPGHRFGHYRILRQIGRGGQATVYLAEDTRLERKLALKILDPAPASSKQSIARFLREAEITSRLDHPGICAVYETGESGGAFWIAMRYVDGESLATKIGTAKGRPGFEGELYVDLSRVNDDHPPSARTDPEPTTGPTTSAEIAQLLSLFEQAARALHVAHEHGVIHRDIKPGNIMVTRDGDPVILDFGLAHEIDGGQVTLTLTGALMGTPAYMSPEQVAGQRLRLDRRTDVYSLGVSLYECLTLNRPFDAPTRDGIYQAILMKAPPDVRASNRSVSKDLKVVLETAMEKDRDRRYQTALDLAEELKRVRVHEPIRARPVGPILRLRRWSQRNPGLATALTGLFVVLAIGLVVALILLGKSERERVAKQKALEEREAALEAKTAALTDYDRLGDLSRLQSLVAEADLLWPCEPSKAEAMSAWVDAGAALEKRLAGHKEVRDRFRASPGLMAYTEADRATDLKAHAADQEQLGKLRTQRVETAAALAAESRAAWRPLESRTDAGSSHASHPTSRPSLADLRPVLANLDANIERLTWKFESSADQFKHDTTAKLVAELTAFLDHDPKKGLLADVRGRLAFAESVERETIGKYETKWADAIRSIGDTAECPKYTGLKIKPQLSLIPLWKDPASGLWEFVHLQTATPGTDPIPQRGQGGRLVVTEDMGIVFVLLPGGTFRMGAMKEPPDEDTPMSAPNVDPDAEADGREGPVTDVTLGPFFLSKYEMTQSQWQRLVGRNPSFYGPGKNFGGKVVSLSNPVEQVSWEDCDLWLERLGLLLPTEAQWEYGARGGTTTPRWTGLGTEGLVKAANLADQFCKENGGMPHWPYEAWNDGYVVHARVGSFDPNPFGIHDVLGNVVEWCRDWYGGYDLKPRPGDHSGIPWLTRRVVRGGSYLNYASLARSAGRMFAPPENRQYNLGVRPVRSLRRD